MEIGNLGRQTVCTMERQGTHKSLEYLWHTRKLPGYSWNMFQLTLSKLGSIPTEEQPCTWQLGACGGTAASCKNSLHSMVIASGQEDIDRPHDDSSVRGGASGAV